MARDHYGQKPSGISSKGASCRMLATGGTVMSEIHDVLMREAIAVANESIASGQSPFGAVIATAKGAIVCRAHNVVRSDCDATAHAEVVAIRRACSELGTIDLSGHIVVTTCEPCPMCAGAIHWARLDAVVYGAAIADATAAGFNELSLPLQDLYRRGGSKVLLHPGVLRQECADLFQAWHTGPHPAPY
jgi:tRNA(Arg) A34 adenosine deaminase TadA